MKLRVLTFAANVALGVLAPRAAAADWSQASGGSAQSSYFTAVSAIDRTHLVAAGVTIDLAHLTSPYLRKVMASDDGGRTFRDISGTLDDMGGRNEVTALFFLDAQTGWVASGRELSRTRDGGTGWVTRAILGELGAIHFFDASRGVLAGRDGFVTTTGDGGDTFQSVAAVTDVDLHHLYFIDDRRGWAVGHDTRTEMTEGGDATFEMGGAVIITNDGGATWRLGAEFDGLGLGPITMLADGMHGYLAAHRRSDPMDIASEAILFATSDGGESFQEVSLPLAVGTLRSTFGDSEIHASRFFAMHWEDAMRGHLAGVAHLISYTSGMSNGMMSTRMQSASWRVVDYMTGDGGRTWTKTDVGTVMMQGLTPPPSDGSFFAGAMGDLCSGWLAGDRQLVWAYTAADSCRSAPGGSDGGVLVPDSGGTSSMGDAAPPIRPGGGDRTREESCGCTSAGEAGSIALVWIFALLALVKFGR